MPKATETGASYAGHDDVSNPESVTPDWAAVPAPDGPDTGPAKQDEADVSRETSAERPSPTRKNRKP